MRWITFGIIVVAASTVSAAQYNIECTEAFCIAIRDDGATFFASVRLSPMYGTFGFYWYRTNDLSKAPRSSPLAQLYALCEVITAALETKFPSGEKALEKAALAREFKDKCPELPIIEYPKIPAPWEQEAR
jgi:hypothetical protein